MTTRRQWHLSALSAVVSAALLAACGGGGSDEKLDVGKVVSFGDSVSDLGAYTPVTQIPQGQAPGVPPFFGGRWTTNTFTGYTATSNTSTANLWIEWVAAKVGVPITVAEVGFAGRSVKCPAAANPATAESCNGYGMGGSLITDPIGIRHEQGALTVPLVTQVANHLAKSYVNGKFDGNDIVFVTAGSNETFVNAGAVAAGLAPATAIANMQAAANELATLLKDQVLANGAKRVAVINVPDLAVTPEGSAQSEGGRALLTQLTAAFNATLEASLAGTGVRIIDVRTWWSDLTANPAKYGFVNSTTAACDLAKIAAVTGGRVTDGSSLSCNASEGVPFNGMKAGASASTWFYADSNHPTTGGHKAFGDLVITNLKNYGWIPPNL